ncbi:hypothetical protein M011DRAFT_13128 [Sporormia fimetaria CBS 119925]|uniref:AA1-like domain-containing protein n=1 Tax=Sporormia fimetaria CBS 119925 TaxID=1340428 RepID=A0A6A6VQD8_9PLEO|nr:hypothetical protein M011DRAFT_13128 [Sporormia fimetaria CBS 119925]
MHAVALFSLLAGLTAAAPTTSIKAANLARSIVARAPAGANPVLKSVTSTGSGCNANSAQFVYNDQASVVFDAMVVSTDVRTTSCVLEFDLELDPAWKYTVDKRGQLQGYSEGGNGRFKSTFSLAGQTVILLRSCTSPS